MAAQRIKGVLSPVVTPFKRDLSPDVGRFIAHCKWLLSELRGRDPALDATIDVTARSIASVRAGDEAREGIDAFFSRRKPSWAP